MDAVIETGGKQYRVVPGDEVKIEKLRGNVGDDITFDRVLFSSDGETIKIGQPFLESCKVTGKITRQAKDRKIKVFKYKRRKGYRRTKGHRQQFSLVRIENIEA